MWSIKVDVARNRGDTLPLRSKLELVPRSIWGADGGVVWVQVEKLLKLVFSCVGVNAFDEALYVRVVPD